MPNERSNDSGYVHCPSQLNTTARRGATCNQRGQSLSLKLICVVGWENDLLSVAVKNASELLSSSGTFFANYASGNRYCEDIMRLQQLRKHGRIAKVIQVRFAPREVGCESNLESCDGYGILQDDKGQEIYFVDEALENARLTELRVGMDVEYLAEKGPLQRASKIWIVPGSE